MVSLILICTSILTCSLGTMVYIVAQDKDDKNLKLIYSIIGVLFILLGLNLIFK